MPPNQFGPSQPVEAPRPVGASLPPHLAAGPAYFGPDGGGFGPVGGGVAGFGPSTPAVEITPPHVDPVAAGGGGGNGDAGTANGTRNKTDAEPKRPTFLVEPEHHETFGSDAVTAPPVIGE